MKRKKVLKNKELDYAREQLNESRFHLQLAVNVIVLIVISYALWLLSNPSSQFVPKMLDSLFIILIVGGISYVVLFGFHQYNQIKFKSLCFGREVKKNLPRTIGIIVCIVIILILFFGYQWKAKNIDSPEKKLTFNETCQKEGYDYATPILIGNETAGFNCCKAINKGSVDCNKTHMEEDKN